LRILEPLRAAKASRNYLAETAALAKDRDLLSRTIAVSTACLSDLLELTSGVKESTYATLHCQRIDCLANFVNIEWLCAPRRI